MDPDHHTPGAQYRHKLNQIFDRQNLARQSRRRWRNQHNRIGVQGKKGLFIRSHSQTGDLQQQSTSHVPIRRRDRDYEEEIKISFDRSIDSQSNSMLQDQSSTMSEETHSSTVSESRPRNPFTNTD